MQTKPKANSVVTSAYDAAAKTLTFRVLGAGEAVLHMPRVSQAVLDRFLIQGANQRCVNAAALEHDKTSGKAATPEQKFAGVQRLVDHYNTGTEDYSPAARTGPKPLDSLLMAAVAEGIGKTLEETGAFIEAGAKKHSIGIHAYLAKVASTERIAPIVTRLRAETVSDDIDIDADLDEVSDGE